jgi:hypothetical protein
MRGTVKYKWWLKYLYLPGMHIFLKLMRSIDPSITPDMDKMNNIVRKGIILVNVRRVEVNND